MAKFKRAWYTVDKIREGYGVDPPLHLDGTLNYVAMRQIINSDPSKLEPMMLYFGNVKEIKHPTLKGGPERVGSRKIVYKNPKDAEQAAARSALEGTYKNVNQADWNAGRGSVYGQIDKGGNVWSDLLALGGMGYGLNKFLDLALAGGGAGASSAGAGAGGAGAGAGTTAGPLTLGSTPLTAPAATAPSLGYTSLAPAAATGALTAPLALSGVGTPSLGLSALAPAGAGGLLSTITSGGGAGLAGTGAGLAGTGAGSTLASTLGNVAQTAAGAASPAGTGGEGGNLLEQILGGGDEKNWLDYLLGAFSAWQGLQASGKTEESLELERKIADWMMSQGTAMSDFQKQFWPYLEEYAKSTQPIYEQGINPAIKGLLGLEGGKLPEGIPSGRDIYNAYVTPWNVSATDYARDKYANIGSSMARRGLTSSSMDWNKQAGTANWLAKQRALGGAAGTQAMGEYTGNMLRNLMGMSTGRGQELGQFSSMFTQPAFGGAGGAANIYGGQANIYGNQAGQNWQNFFNSLQKPEFSLEDFWKQLQGI